MGILEVILESSILYCQYRKMPDTSTYTKTYTVGAGVATVFPETPDLTGRVHTIEVNTDGDCQVEIQTSTDGGTTWEIFGDDYKVDNVRDKRSILCDGIIRTTITSNEASASQTVTLTIETTSISSMHISPEDVWRTAGITADVMPRGDVAFMINRAIGGVEGFTHRKYEATQITEKYAGDNGNILILKKYPVISLDTLTIDGTDVSPDNVDVWERIGKLILTNDAEKTTFESESDGSRSIEVTYTYGETEAPQNVKRLMECSAAIQILIAQLGGTYNDITSYSIGGLEASLGEPWTNIDAAIKRLQNEINWLLKQIQKQPYMA